INNIHLRSALDDSYEPVSHRLTRRFYITLLDAVNIIAHCTWEWWESSYRH
ncbi:17733_t:CDS:1, partial [Cetraspora pellucida]